MEVLGQVKTVFDKNAEMKTGKSVDGMRTIVEEQAKAIDRKAYHTKLEFIWDKNEALYVKEYRERRISLDLIVLDWKSWPGELWGQKSFDPERFPDPKGMMKQLHDLNARLMVSIWPNMSPGGENHREMKRKGFLLGNQATYDAFYGKPGNYSGSIPKMGFSPTV